MKNEKMTANITNPITTSLHTNSDGTVSLRVTPKVTKFDFAAYKANNAKTANNANNAVDGDAKNGKSAEKPKNARLKGEKTKSKKSTESIPNNIFSSFGQLVYEVEHFPTVENTLKLSVAITICVVKKCVNVSPDNKVLLKMFSDILSEPNYGIAADHVNTAFIEIWSLYKDSIVYDSTNSSISPKSRWLTGYRIEKRLTRHVIYDRFDSNTLQYNPKYKGKLCTPLQSVFHKVRESISAFDGFRMCDNRFTYIEIDNLLEDSKIYLAMVYYIDSIADKKRLDYKVSNLNLNPTQIKVLKFRLLHPYAGAKVTANNTDLPLSTVKYAIKAIQKRFNEVYGTNIELKVNEDSAKISRKKYVGRKAEKPCVYRIVPNTKNIMPKSVDISVKYENTALDSYCSQCMDSTTFSTNYESRLIYED